MRPSWHERIPAAPYVLRGGKALRPRVSKPEWLDIAVGADGRIAAVGTGMAIAPGTAEVMLDGALVVPGLVDVHQHLDKALTRRMVDNPAGTLDGAVAAFATYAAGMTRDDISRRARRIVERCLAHGTVAIRSHANVDPELRTRAVEALVALRESLHSRLTLQIVAFATGGATRRGADAEAWLKDAVAAGADVIGGTPAIADDPIAFLDMLFAVADRHGLPLDLHLDEHLDGERQLLEAVSDRTRALGLRGRVALGHCSALSALAPERAKAVIAGFRDAGIRVITLPAANLFLQGRYADRLPPRGLTRVRELLDAGVPVAAASDNIEDAFIPVGSGDLLEIARWTLLAAGLRTNDLDTAFAMVTSVPAEVMGIEADYGIKPGAWADLLITDCDDIEDLVARGPVQRLVLTRGRPVSAAVAAGG
jgi:cytosine deaminase